VSLVAGLESVTGPTSSISEGKKRLRTGRVIVPPDTEHPISTRASKTLRVSALGSGLVLFHAIVLGRSAKVMLDLGSECSLIHSSLLEGCDLVCRASGLKM